MLKLSDFKNGTFNKQLLIRISILLGIVIIAIIVLVLVKKNINKKALSIQDLRAQAQEMTLAGETFATLMKEYQTIGPYLQDLENVLPPKDKLIDFSKELFDLADSLGMELSFLFQNEESIGKLKAINFSMVLKNGEISDFINFLSNLKTSKYFITLESFDISGASLKEIVKGDKTLSISMRGKIFVEEDKKE